MHDFRDQCYWQCSVASVCNYPSNNITVKHYFGTVRLLQPKTNQSSIYGLLVRPTATNLVFERETYMACTTPTVAPDTTSLEPFKQRLEARQETKPTVPNT